ncbi:hypothetical protein F5Y14DRAFT_418424 [Nemania sp. NC0429]|nr:hypothetical protein F5Y14DRAFT_418424 [Nemania sp. NC0429]
MKLLATIVLLAGAAKAFRFKDAGGGNLFYSYANVDSYYVIEWDPEGAEGTFQLEMNSFSNYPVLRPPNESAGLPYPDHLYNNTVLSPAIPYSDKHYTHILTPIDNRLGFNFTYNARARDANGVYLDDARPFNLIKFGVSGIC